MSNPVLERLVDERERLNENIDDVLQQAASEERDPSDAERELVVRHRSRLDQVEAMIVEQADLEETRQKARDAGTLVRRRETTPAPDNGDDDSGDDEGGEGEYRTFAQYARDVVLTKFDRIAATVPQMVRKRAQERLHRAPAPVLLADIPGIRPTQYINQIMQVINRSRPLVDASNRVPLTTGKLQWPHITDRPTVAEQVTEKTEAGDGAMQVDFLEAAAKTYLVAANFSWQVVNWSSPDAMALWFDLAAESYAKATDNAAGAVLAAADATPTAVAGDTLEDWMAGLSAAAGEVYANTGRFPNAFAANPVEGFKLLSMVGAVSPVFVSTGTGSFTGSFPSIGGLRPIISNGIPAGTVVVGDFSALLCAETAGSPVELRAVEPSIGGIEVGIIGAFACAVSDPGAFAELTAPVAGP